MMVYQRHTRKFTDNTAQDPVTTNMEDDGVKFSAATPSSEAEEGLESWADENYQGIIDAKEYLDSSRVKRID